MKKQNNILMGIFCIIMAGFGFSLMSLFVKLSGDLPSMQKGIFRNIIAAIISAIPLFKHRFNITTPKCKEEWAVLVGRSIFGTIGLVLNFYAKIISFCNYNLILYIFQRKNDEFSDRSGNSSFFGSNVGYKT